MVETISLMGILGYFSVKDIRDRQIGMVPLTLAAIGGVLLHLCYERISIWNLLGGIGIGMGLYGISVLSHEKIGKGDALLIGVTGIFLGFWDNLIVLWIASLVAAVTGMVAVLIFHKGKRYELPFIPCVFLSFIVYVWMQNGGLS